MFRKLEQVPLPVPLDGAAHAVQERDALAAGWRIIGELPIRISARRSIWSIERIIHEHAAQGGQYAVLDQISHFEVPNARVGFEQATTASAVLRHAAVSARIPLLVIAQVNRAAAKSKNERLASHDLRDSGMLENDS